RGLLLGRLLRLAGADAELLTVDHRRAPEPPVVRRAFDAEDGVADRLPATRERLLQLRLVVDVARERVVEPARERLDDRLLDRLEAVLEEQRGQRGLEQRREDVAVVRQPLELVLGNVGAALGELPAEIELARDDGAARARDDVRADLREPALAEVRVALVQLARDRELEHAVAEKLQPFVRGGPLTRP